MRDEQAIFEDHTHPLAPIPTGASPRGLSSTKRVTAMIFDVYGTLLISDSKGKDFQSMDGNQKRVLAGVLQRYGIDRTPEDLTNSLHRTIESDHDKRRREGIEFPEVDILQIWKRVLGKTDARWLEMFALEYEMVVNPVYPMPGLEDLLLACRERNLLMGIISNAQFYTPRILGRLLGTSLDRCGFDPGLTLFSHRFKAAKPSGCMFELAAEVCTHRGVPCRSVLYVGNDMRNDILPAKKVGFKTALFAGDRRSLRTRADDVTCRHLTPDAIVTDLRQLIADTGNPPVRRGHG